MFNLIVAHLFSFGVFVFVYAMIVYFMSACEGTKWMCTTVKVNKTINYDKDYTTIFFISKFYLLT